MILDYCVQPANHKSIATSSRRNRNTTPIARRKMALVTQVNFGPKGWTSNEECRSLYSISVARCNNNTDWYEVMNMCSKLRKGIPCIVSSSFTVGWQYLSKLIDFNDGVRWVIHVPLDYTGPGSTACITDRMSRKVSTYKFLK